MRSMTGFGRCEVTDGERKITVEMKSVNHRYFDANIHMPKKLLAFESAVRGILKNNIARGKVDVFITYEDLQEQTARIGYNHDAAAVYAAYFQQMSEEFDIANDLTASKLAALPDVLTLEEKTIPEDEIWNLMEEAVQKATEQFIQSREAEGAHLQKDLLEKLDGMLVCVDFIEQYSPSLIEQYRAKLETKVQEILKDKAIDESRIVMEVTMFADKICVDEETVRLKSHINATKDTLKTAGSIGKRLDFIAQEMNREANTILSKSNDLSISDRAITLKTEIEKVREQIQNIE